MILPIIAYGDPVLKKKAKEIETDTDLTELLANMYETMYNAAGVGLAAPQIGKSLRLFIIDAEPMDEENLKGFKKVFINPTKIEEDGSPWMYEEGCLSIPDVREQISRPEMITLKYFDEDWKEHTETFTGLAARVIQHEYDHIEGVLFTDKLSSIRKRLLRGRLNKISMGKVKADYRMKFPKL